MIPKPLSQDLSISPAADASALVMVALIFFLFGCFFASGFILYRRSKRPRTWHAELTDPFPRPKASEKQIKENQSERAPWEKDAHWWK